MSVVCEPFPDVGDAAEGVRPGDGFLAGHSRRAASLTVQDRTAEGLMVGPRRAPAEGAPGVVSAVADGVDAGSGSSRRGAVNDQLAAVEPLVRGICRSR